VENISTSYMNKFIYLLIGLLFVACAGQKSEPLQMVEAFPVEKSLFAEKVKVNEVFSLSKMMCKGNYLFASDVRSNENLIHQYSLPDFKCVYKGGSKGQAEDEFQIFPIFCNTPADKVYIWGYTMFSVKSFTLDNAGQLSFERKYDLPMSGDTYNDVHVVRDSILVMKEVTQLAIKKINLNNQQMIGEIKFKKDEHNEPFFCENAGYMVANDSLIVYAYHYKKQIDIYDMDDMKLKKRLVGDEIAPHIVLYDSENTVYRNYGIYAGKDYFYVWCPGKWGVKNGCSIEVFDYSGGSIAKYELDVMLTTFTIDEQNRAIYGYNDEVFEDGFLKFSL
jgi:hypothetical protein